MDNKVSPDAGSMEQHLANLAALLDQHSLTHLEYETNDSRVVLGKEPAPIYQAAYQAGSTATASAASAGATSSAALANMTQASLGQMTADATPAQGLASAACKTAATSKEADGELVTAPLVGIAYSAKEPGAAPFASVGDVVKEGTVLCLIEAMKMFNEVKAPISGKIVKIHFEDTALVEYGAPLFTLDVSAS